ncbi:MAG TPA: diguanylate cyclase [Thermoleophilaceae bacterium]|nr:diguanylate cyclase [Thermoleophilaceae bacterium]
MAEIGDARVACTLTSTLLKRVRAGFGEEGVRQVVRSSGVTNGADHLEQVDNWIDYADAVSLFEAAVEVTADQQIGWRVGQDAVRQHAGTAVATLLRSLGSPERIYEQIALTATKFSTVTDMTPTEVSPGRAVVRARNRLGIARHPQLCDYTRGMLSQPPMLFGLPAAAVEESTCAARGDDACVYTVSWDADAATAAAQEPQALITALEAQLEAMRDRLDSMYATASDLIALDDVDSALARITERAASAVRAPTYLLAVHMRETLHVHSRGLAEEDAERCAQELLDGDGSEEGDSRLVAEVASRQRSYGRIMAASPAGGFFPSERELFEVYARYAAAVLDSAMAFDEARREHDQSRALLELSQAFTSATTRDEVAQSLAEAIPSLVDCDRVVVYLWDEEEARLSWRAATGARADDPILLPLEIRQTDSPLLRKPDSDESAATPRFAALHDADPFVRSLMETLSGRELVAVPISLRGVFHGILIVVTTSGRGRLAETPELSELLSGVVAHTGTALESTRLLETLAHRALHDGLTGLLGHRAFHEILESSLASGKDRAPITLAMVDIDDFKAINDKHGHPVGDEALRLVATELQRAVRDDDTVFRVGGEEFAVLFRGVPAADALPIAERLRAGVEGIEFIVPLRVSVGLASWPDLALDRDGLVRNADAALYDAKRAGKNRTTTTTATA